MADDNGLPRRTPPQGASPELRSLDEMISKFREAFFTPGADLERIVTILGEGLERLSGSDLQGLSSEEKTEDDS